MTDVLRVDGLSKSFGALSVLDGVGFSVKPGECLALCGENGAGKSTLLRILMGLQTGDAGSFHAPSGMGMVHQHFSLVPALTVSENVWLGAEPLRFGLFDHKRARAETLRLANEIGWHVAPDARVETLTVGERQRVEVLKALRSGAKMLLLDEPTATLTHPEVLSFLDVLRKLTARGTSILFVSHKLNEVAMLCGRALVLRRGKIVAELPASDHQAVAAAMIGETQVGASDTQPATQGAIVLEARALHASHRGSELRDASFSVHAGEILGIAGVDGNGQDALFAALAGTTASGGHLSLQGSVKQRRGRGLRSVPSDRHRDALLLGRSLEDNLQLGHDQKVQDALPRLQTWDVRPAEPARDVAELSGGNQQKLLFARELGDNEAKVIVLHEPTRGVDWFARERIWGAIRAATKRGAACVVISSDYDELKTLSDTLAVLYRGTLSPQRKTADTSDAEIGQAMGGLS